jgi:hypothetical protein
MVTDNNNPAGKNPDQVTRDSWELEEEPLAKAIDLADLLLSICTGHDDYQRRKIAYYIVATYFVRKFDPFPGLVLYGSPSTGKSATLNIIRGLCWRPVLITAETTTPAALKQSMREANEGTLIIEEADKISAEELEAVLITRYSKSSAALMKMVPEERGWIGEKSPTFGATVLHRRNLFKDPALLRRMIVIRTRRRKGEYHPLVIGRKIHDRFENYLRVLPALPEVTNDMDIEPGIFDCYKPLIAMATYIDDAEFFSKLVKELEEASLRLRREETYLEAPTFLKVIIGLASEASRGKFTFDRINIETRRLQPALTEEFGSSCPALKLSANQRNRSLEDDLGFKVGSSHGRSRIYLTIPQLIEKCDEYGVKDDLIEEWRKEAKGH